jgi:hypothetical protein
MTDQHIAKLRDLFDAYDKDKDGSLGLNELVILLEELGNKITALPAVSVPMANECKGSDTALPDCSSRFTAGQVPGYKTF